MTKRSAIIDIESNGFIEEYLDVSSFPYKLTDEAKLWCVVVRDLDTGEEWFAELEDVTEEWLKTTLEPFYYIIAHNGIKFDFLQLYLFGIFKYKIGYIGQPDTVFGRECKFLDSLILSRLANPDRGGHSLAFLGRRVGELKDDYRQQCIEAGYIEASDPPGAEFREYNPLMLPYCKQDCKTNAKVFKSIIQEYRDHNWGDSIQMEHKLADLAIRRQFLGFDFDKDLAEKCLEELNEKLENLADKVEPLIPPKPLNKTELNFWTPPKTQIKKNGELGTHMINFLSRIGATCKDDGFVFEDKFYPIPYEEGSIKTHVPAQMKDFDHIKMYLISFGWDPIEWSERDMTKDSKKKNLSYEKRVAVLDRWWKDTIGGKYKEHRLEHARESLWLKPNCSEEEIYEKFKEKLEEKWPVRVYTAPKIRVGIERDLCPNLIKLGEKVSFAKDFADWLTYRHRRNAIAGGEIDEDTGTPSSGFLSAYREVDGRVPTPSIEIGASTCRYTHKIVANIPRASSTYGKEMRSLFRAGDGAVFFGFDYSSLENRIQGHYIYKYPGGPEMAESLVAEKPNDSHTKNSELLGIPRSEVKSFTYACVSGDTEVLTTSGFTPITEICKGDSIITYNTELDILEDDVVLNTVNFNNKEIYSLKSGSFKIKSTADHRWYGRERVQKNKKRFYKNKFFTTEEINSEKSILNSAIYFKESSEINITDYEAKLLGYIASDGYLKWSKVNPNKIHEKRGVSLRITQSENKFIGDIIFTLNMCNLKYTQYGKKEGVNPVYDFVIQQEEARNFLDKIFKERKDKHEIDWTKFVLSLSIDSRLMFYNGFFNGDGHREKRKWDRITQNYGTIYDAITLCCFLDGYRVSHQKKTDSCGVIAKQQKRYTTGQKMTKTNLGIQPSYCITTNNSTFVIKQGNTITITGNCLYGAAAPKIAKMLSCPTSKAKNLLDDFWNGNPALNALKKNLEKYWETTDKKFVLGIDRRKIRTRSKHSLLNALFQSGGVIFAKYVSVYLMQKMEEEGLCIDPFVGKPDICSMIEYHDEQDMYANPALFKFQTFDTEKAAEEFSKKWTGRQLSAVSKGKDKYFVALPNPVSIGIEDSIEIVKNRLNISVEMGFEYMLGNNWYECH